MLEKNASLETVQASDICTINPKSIAADVLAIDALDMLRSYNITQLVVLQNGAYIGILHLHDLVKEGLI